MLLASQGLANDIIAARLDTPRQIVSKWRQRFFAERLPGLDGSPRRASSPLFPPASSLTSRRWLANCPSDWAFHWRDWSVAELRREAVAKGIVAKISGTTLWRWLSQDALRPWRHRSWIFPRDPLFAAKAGPILDLYHRCWHGKPLGKRDFVISADEETSIQARRRKHPTLPPAPGRPIYVEHEYARVGAWAYLAAWDVHRAKLFGRCERKTGIVPFDRLVAQVMEQEPYRSARRVFWIVDNGSSHRGQRARDRLRANGPTWSSSTPRFTPAGSTRSRSTSRSSNASSSPPTISLPSPTSNRLLQFQLALRAIGQAFRWTFTRRDLDRLLAKLANMPPALPLDPAKYVTVIANRSTSGR